MSEQVRSRIVAAPGLDPEVETHQFTAPLATRPAPSKLVQFAAAAVSARRWFRVGWTCQCVVDLLTVAEQEMLLRGEIDNSLDIYQLQGHATASAGTHALYACFDLGQTSDAQIDTLRRCGAAAQRRYTSQGFQVEHTHGFPNGDTHGSSGQKSQQIQWNDGTNGLISRGRIEGRWPIKQFKAAIAERKKVVMALADDIAQKSSDLTVAQLSGRIASPADVLGWQGINISPTKRPARWSAAHILSWLQRSVATGDQVGAVQSQVITLQAQVAELTTLVQALPKGPQS